ncbi:hypothetical protein NN561_001394 [Cricetulus griseus]
MRGHFSKTSGKSAFSGQRLCSGRGQGTASVEYQEPGKSASEGSSHRLTDCDPPPWPANSQLPGTGLLRVWGHKGCGRRPGRAHRPRLRAGTLVQVHARGSRAPGAQRTQASERASGAGCWVCQPEGQRREAVLALAAVLRGHSAGWGTASCSRAARGRRKPSPEAGTESGTPLTARAGPAAAPLRQARPTFQRALSEARLRHPRDTPATSARPSRGAGLVTHAVGPQAACTGARRSPCLILAVRCRGRVSPHCRPTVGQSGSCPNWVCGPRLFRGKQVLESSLVGET